MSERDSERHQQRPERTAVTRLGAQLPLEQREQDRADGHPREEGNALEESEMCVLEVELDIAGTERADGQRWEERPDPDRSRDAEPLEDVEDEVHRAVP